MIHACKGIDIGCQTQCIYRAMSKSLDAKPNEFALRSHAEPKQITARLRATW